eukprot:CAMPEP_0118880728 /NCGR_PEP_ID=MMETSP1163-20130328/20248_1 /TAXON_ID=124430 /ORGANISM="Phaeomonas parva, Strain CCMP2877" /LENGTH=647 /DNA_ID=CAMNT_0006817245 /DNA_START=138 /DNA_END=2081 /DNA_ORIENTATION=-
MARGTLKSLKRTRPDKGGKSSGSGSSGGAAAAASAAAQPGAPAGPGDDLDDIVSWLNCECLVSLLLVGVLAALPFNLQSNDFLHAREGFVTRAEDYYNSGAFDKAAVLYDRAVALEETPEGHLYLAETLAHPDLNRVHEAIRHYTRAAELFDDEDERVGIWKSVGKLYNDIDRPDLAADSYQRVLDSYADGDPTDLAEANLQLGLSLLDGYRFREAVEHLGAVTALKPTNGLAQLSIADTQRDLGNAEAAVQRYRRVMKHRPRDFTALTGLAFTYHGNGSYEKAISTYHKAQAVNPTAPEVEYALRALRNPAADGEKGNNRSGGHGGGQLLRAPPGYVSFLFDLVGKRKSFLENPDPEPRTRPRSLAANTSDAKKADADAAKPEAEAAVGQEDAEEDGATPAVDEESQAAAADVAALETEAAVARARDAMKEFNLIFGIVFKHLVPMIRDFVQDALQMRNIDGWHWLDVLDLGCGSGEVALAFRGLSNRIVGVDISKVAIALSRRTKLYNELHHADFSAVLEVIDASTMDVVTAADSLPYFGDLEGLFASAAAVLRGGGVFAFNLDTLESTSSRRSGGNRPFLLRHTGRWMHSPSYVRELAVVHGFRIVREVALRSEVRDVVWEDGELLASDKLVPVQGAVYVLQKK